jgi:hypothetical protein
VSRGEKDKVRARERDRVRDEGERDRMRESVKIPKRGGRG